VCESVVMRNVNIINCSRFGDQYLNSKINKMVSVPNGQNPFYPVHWLDVLRLIPPHPHIYLCGFVVLENVSWMD
jgi:hypothetical protein